MTYLIHSKSLWCPLRSVYRRCAGDAGSLVLQPPGAKRRLWTGDGLFGAAQSPPGQHPLCSSYATPNSNGEILHDQAQYWGQKGIHYHQFLKAGENTLNVKICRLLIESINQTGTYDADDFLKRNISPS